MTMKSLTLASLLLWSSACSTANAFTTQTCKKTSASMAHKTIVRSMEEQTTNQEQDKSQQQQQDEEPVYYPILTEQGGPTSASSVADAQMKAQLEMNTVTRTSEAYPIINGWYPKEDYALWGLPGAIAPTGYFDPLGFARRGTSLNDAKRLREAEVMHARVAMMATVGYLAGEFFPSPFGITGPANDQLQQVPLPIMVVLTAAIATVELYRAKRGWVEPTFRVGSGTLWTLRDSYYPGDLGFDPCGFKPTENYAFQRIQTAELSNGRLAMLGWAGMCAQELVNHRTLGETVDFYAFVLSGGNPYEYY